MISCQSINYIYFVVSFLHLICINAQNPGHLLKKEGRICDVNICKNGGLCVLVEEIENETKSCICSLGYTGIYFVNLWNHEILFILWYKYLKIVFILICFNGYTYQPLII